MNKLKLKLKLNEMCFVSFQKTISLGFSLSFLLFSHTASAVSEQNEVEKDNYNYKCRPILLSLIQSAKLPVFTDEMKQKLRTTHRLRTETIDHYYIKYGFAFNLYAEPYFDEETREIGTPIFLTKLSYDIQAGELLNIERNPLEDIDFNKNYVGAYFNCTYELDSYKVSGSGRLYFYEDSQLSKKMQDTFILPNEYVEIITKQEDAVEIEYTSRAGKKFTGWVDANRISDASLYPYVE